MVRLRALIAAASALLAITVTGGAAPAAVTSVLFVGNSYTFYNNLPELVRQVAAGTTGSIHTALCGAGGATLAMHYENPRCQQALAGRRWDLVILQEQSTLGRTAAGDRGGISDPRRTFWPGVRQWDDAIRRRGARTGLFMTWARRDAPEQQAQLTDAYLTIGRERDALVIPVGNAWQRFRREQPQVALHDADGSHPTAAGSYLAAVTVLSAMLDQRVPLYSHRLLVHPSPEGVVNVSQTQTVEVSLDVRVQAHESAWQAWIRLKQR